MTRLLSETAKVDIALTPANLNSSATGPYYKMDEFGKALFIVNVGAMAKAATSALQVVQAKDAAGSNVKAITNNAATITANIGVASAKLTAANVVATNTFKINGLTFTAVDSEPDAAEREFAKGSSNNDAATNIAEIINDPDYGVPGVKATAASAVVTVTAIEPGKTNITIEGTATTIEAATLSAVGYIECDVTYMDYDNGFTHIALKITNSAATYTGAVVLRGNGRYSPAQKVAAAKTNVVEAM